MEKAQDYSELKETEIVFICTFDPFGRGLDRYDFENVCKQLPELKLNSGTKKTFINTSATNGRIPETVKNLYEYINTGLVSDALTSEVDRAVERAGADNKVKDEIMRSELILMDMRREGMAEGRAAGLEEGLKLGLEKGLKEGREKGLEEGLEEGRRTALVDLFRAGIITEAQACKELDMTLEDFKQLLN
jgi:predicted transposase/invertase (TIGR01784 family)